MESSTEISEFELISVIVNFGLGSRALKIAKQHGVTGGTILIGEGTVRNRLLEFLDLCDVRKEIVLMVCKKAIGYKALEAIDRELELKKLNHGIAYSVSIRDFIGAGECECKNYSYTNNDESKGAKNTMYNAIFVIVDKGKAEYVMEAATKVGAKGGTIINARGSGIHETSKLFFMDVEPEKEIVLILSENQLTESIISSIREQLKIDEPGKGIIFVQDVNKTYGLS